MTRLNIVLLTILIAFSLGLVTAQHKARKLFIALEKEQDHEKQLNVEWGQLQLEQSTWATHARIEKIATRSMGMRVPEMSKIRTVVLDDRPANPASSEAPQ
ncbi:MAG TPA: cell division protein FtsL [Burkholderiales bacterium]|jgi:cell division protein FtsL|nr:cell division protein FtsL [Burkholderiales bacterium]